MPLVLSTSARWLIASSGRQDSSTLLARLGLDATGNDQRLVDADAFYGIIETIVSDGDDELPFRCAESLDIDSYGALGLAFKTAVDLRTALGRIQRYGVLVSDAIRYELRPAGATPATFTISGRPASRLGMQVTNEAALAGVLSFCRQAVAPGQSPTPSVVSFTHRRPTNWERYETFFGCPVQFGAEFDGLHLDEPFLDTPTRLGDEALGRFLTDQLDGELQAAESARSIESRVRHTLSQSLADGVPPMGAVATRLAMSERTLRRRLAEESIRYEDIVVEVQRTVATALLETTDHPLVDVAFFTGYSDQSAFHRAFKRWTGKTPQEVRRSSLAAGGRQSQSSGR
jgi:AraC-like DNA-binding protein